MTHMPHVYEFQIHGVPVARMNFRTTLAPNEMDGIRLMLANWYGVLMDEVCFMYESINVTEE
jgi:hypothetical protein